MIFHPELIALIKDRRKTQTRRIAHLKPNGEPIPSRYKTGRVYKAQPGRGKPGQLDITIINIRLEPLGQITREDALREGFKFPAQFEEHWRQLHGHHNPEQLVWVISFLAGDETDRFDQPRLLAATPGHVEYTTEKAARQGAKGRWQIAPDGTEHQDYTDQSRLALLDAGEAVTAAEQARITKEAHARDRARAADPIQVERDKIVEALENIEDILRQNKNRDVRHTVRSLRHQLAVLDRKLKDAA